MRQPLLLSFLALAIAFHSANSRADDPKAAAPENLKIGSVNMKRVFEAYSGAKEAEARISEKREQGRKELGERSEAAKKSRAEIEKLDREIANLAPGGAEREEKTMVRQKIAAALEKQDHDIQDLQAAQEKDLKDLSERLRAGVIERINKAVEVLVKEGKYDLVFDQSPSRPPPLNIKGSTNTDFTEAVISALNKNPGPSVSPEPAVPGNSAAADEKH